MGNLLSPPPPPAPLSTFSLLSKENLEAQREQERSETQQQRLRIVCVSDTHQKHRALKVPDGDLLVVAGDITKC
jgi:hypothetical protein